MLFENVELGAVFAGLLGAGTITTIVMAIFIWNCVWDETFQINRKTAKAYKIGNVNFKPRVIFHYIGLIVLHLLVMFCIFTIGGIIDAMWVSNFLPLEGWNELDFLGKVFSVLMLAFIIGIPVCLTFAVGSLVLGFEKFTNEWSIGVFLLTFVLSICFWCNYINKYNANIETTTEVVETSKERELIFFYEIPVQQVSGSVSGSSTIFSGSVSGDIFTVDTVPYVYLNDQGNGSWDSAPAKDSEIVFITENEVPKIVIVTSTEKTIKIDHNVNESTVTDTKSWVKYYFYLPKSVVQTFESE